MELTMKDFDEPLPANLAYDHGTIPLRDFLHTPYLFASAVPPTVIQKMQNNPRLLHEQQSYLMSLLQKKEITPQILIRKIYNEGYFVKYAVINGWIYVNTLLQFFRNEIPMPIEIRSYFPDVFDSVTVDMAGRSVHKSISTEDRYFFNLRKCKEFSILINNTVVDVYFTV